MKYEPSQHYLDRETVFNNFIHSLETWYGFIIEISDTFQTKSIKDGLDAILEKQEYKTSEIRGNLIYCKGVYFNETIGCIKHYLDSIDQIEQPIILVKGKYDNFIGNRWVDEMLSDRSKS